MNPEEKTKVNNLEAEVVIIGGGGAGLAAALTAAEKGSSVVVLEKRKVLGGNTAMALGIFASESPTQLRYAIDAPRDEIFRKAMEYSHWKTNPRIVRAFIDKSGDTVRWLEEKGLVFDCVALYYGQSPLVWHKPRGLCAKMIQVLKSECQKLGVSVLTRAPAKKILIGNNGNVTGVVAETKGEEFTIKAKSVIIASGGYGGNRKLIKKYCWYYNDNLICGGLPHKGDGLLMAMDIGAATEDLGFLLRGGLPGPGMAAPRVLDEPYLVRVNPAGKRFIDETICNFQHAYTGNEAIQTTYIIFDQKILQYIMKNGTIYFVGRDRMNRYVPMPELESEFRALADKGSMRISDSWDDIAGYIGCDPKVLKATIDEYNTCCDKGHDPVFVKDPRYLWPLRTPPYYAVGGSVKMYLDTIGGIKINENMEILDKQDTPIPGIYACGVCVGGWQAVDYGGLYMSGAAAGFAVNSGRIAGENAAGKNTPQLTSQ